MLDLFDLWLILNSGSGSGSVITGGLELEAAETQWVIGSIEEESEVT